MLRLTLVGTLTATILSIATTAGYAAPQGGYSPAVYPGSERTQSQRAEHRTTANADAYAPMPASKGDLVRKCIPQACGTPWCYMTRNP